MICQWGKPLGFFTALLPVLLAAELAMGSPQLTVRDAGDIVASEIDKVLRPGGAGAAVAVRMDGRTMFFNFGLADRAARRPITPDSLFNLASLSKVFDATLLALAVKRGDLSFDDRIGGHVRELGRGGDIGLLALGDLVSFTSGFSLPQDHPPWPRAHYTWPKFVRALNNWKSHEGQGLGRQYRYSHAGFMLLHVVMQRRFGMPYSSLLEQQLLQPLRLASTALPARGVNNEGLLPPALKRRAVQGYSGEGNPIGKPGNVQGYYQWPGTGQMYSSARDMATFLTAQLGELPLAGDLQEAIKLTHQGVTTIESGRVQAHAWEMHQGAVTIVDKNGGLDNTTTYIGMIPNRRLGLVILINRGGLNGRDIGHPILRNLAGASNFEE